MLLCNLSEPEVEEASVAEEGDESCGVVAAESALVTLSPQPSQATQPVNSVVCEQPATSPHTGDLVSPQTCDSSDVSARTCARHKRSANLQDLAVTPRKQPRR